MKQFLNKTYCFLPLLFFCIYYVIKSVTLPVHDFANYYFGGNFLLQGTFNSDIYFPHLFNLSIANLGYHNMFVSYAPNTPFLAFIFAPISLINIALAKMLFNVISCFFLLLGLYRLSSFYKLSKYFITLIPLLFFVPFKNNILFGQLYFALFFLLTEFWLAHINNKLTKSALFLSIAIMLKVFPIFFIFIFLFKKQFKPLIVCGISCLILMLLTSLFTGFDIWVFWLKEVFSRASNGEIAGAFVDNYQSFFMFLKRLLIFDITENPYAFFNYPLVFKAIILVLKIGVLAIGFYFTEKKNHTLQMFSFWVLATLFLSPYGSTYSFITLVFFAIYILKLKTSVLSKLLFFASLFLVNNLPTTSLLHLDFPLSYLRLFCFLALIILFFKTSEYAFKRNKVLLVAPIIACISIFFLKAKAQNTRSVLTSSSPILIYDYNINNNKLEFVFWNELGENKNKIPYTFSTKKDLQLKNNQIFYNNKQLTRSKSNKLKPVLIDNYKILFLSDADRGIGFYTLKEIKIN